MIKVIAVRKGTIEGRAYFPGEVFDIDEKLFADVNDADAHQATFGWMQKLDEAKLKDIRDKRNASEKKVSEEEAKQKEKREAERPLSPSELDSYLRTEAQLKKETKAPIVVTGNMLPRDGEFDQPKSGEYQAPGQPVITEEAKGE